MKIAVAPDKVVSRALKLGGMSVREYTLLARAMCLKMESSARNGESQRKWKNWFNDDESDDCSESGDGQAGGGPSVFDIPDDEE